MKTDISTKYVPSIIFITINLSFFVIPFLLRLKINAFGSVIHSEFPFQANKVIDFPTEIMSKTIIGLKNYDDNCYLERTADISPEKIKFKDFKNTFVDH